MGYSAQYGQPVIEAAKMVKDGKELKEILGIGKNQVYDLLHSGTIASIKIGTHFKITKTAVQKYLKI